MPFPVLVMRLSRKISNSSAFCLPICSERTIFSWFLIDYWFQAIYIKLIAVQFKLMKVFQPSENSELHLALEPSQRSSRQKTNLVSANSQVRKIQQLRNLRDQENEHSQEISSEKPHRKATLLQEKKRFASEGYESGDSCQEEEEEPFRARVPNVEFISQNSSSEEEEDNMQEGLSSGSDFMDSEEEKQTEAEKKEKDQKHTFYRQKTFIPPPNPLLQKKFLPSEPVRTGFAQKFVDFKKPEVREETERHAQGVPRPQGQKNQIQQPSSVIQNMQMKEDDDNNAFTGGEKSLREIFYLEYKKHPEGVKNPIVYSRFGKKNYESDEKFDSDKFQCLIRTCNIKKLLKGQLGDTRKANLELIEAHKKKKGISHMNSALLDAQEFISSLKQPFIPGEKESYYKPKGRQDRTLVFESKFESGNLQLAQKLSDYEYNLILQNDINSKGHTQWFYFKVSNTRKGMKVRFNLLNFIKTKSLYNEGMKPLIYSEKGSEKGWIRGGENITYSQNSYRREHLNGVYNRYYSTFTFTHQFKEDEDTVFFAYSLPYTYSDLVSDLEEIEKKNYDFITRNTLCRTLAGNKCEYLTITSKRDIPEIDCTCSESEKLNCSCVQEKRQLKKKGVIITARVHPGESNASWMMKGVIDFLISDQVEAKILRKNYIFKIVPMINPDGVINGNYRCSLAGCDLNRRYKNPNKNLHPTIWHLKNMAKEFAYERPLALYCDLHGHSRRKNIFMYGNTDMKVPEQTRVFPFIISKLAPNHFSYDFSRFKVQRHKESTARISLWRMLKVPNIFTMEASFCGPKAISERLNYHFNSKDLKDIGKTLCQSILVYQSRQDNLMVQEVKQYHQEKEEVSQTQPLQQPNISKVKSKYKQIPQGASNSQNTSMISNSNQQASKTQRILVKAKKDLEKTRSILTDDSVEKEISTESSLQKPAVRDLKQKLQSLSPTIQKFQQIDQQLADNSQLKQQGKSILAEFENKIAKNRERLKKEIIMEESSSGSDSGQSEDNLEVEELNKILPEKQKKQGGNKKLQNAKKKTTTLFKEEKLPEALPQLERQQTEKYDSKKRPTTQRAQNDFKKPTQSFLQKFNQLNPARKQIREDAQYIDFREIQTQTEQEPKEEYSPLKKQFQDQEEKKFCKDIANTSATPNPVQVLISNVAQLESSTKKHNKHQSTSGLTVRKDTHYESCNHQFSDIKPQKLKIFEEAHPIDKTVQKSINKTFETFPDNDSFEIQEINFNIIRRKRRKFHKMTRGTQTDYISYQAKMKQLMVQRQILNQKYPLIKNPLIKYQEDEIENQEKRQSSQTMARATLQQVNGMCVLSAVNTSEPQLMHQQEPEASYQAKLRQLGKKAYVQQMQQKKQSYQNINNRNSYGQQPKSSNTSSLRQSYQNSNNVQKYQQAVFGPSQSNSQAQILQTSQENCENLLPPKRDTAKSLNRVPQQQQSSKGTNSILYRINRAKNNEEIQTQCLNFLSQGPSRKQKILLNQHYPLLSQLAMQRNRSAAPGQKQGAQHRTLSTSEGDNMEKILQNVQVNQQNQQDVMMRQGQIQRNKLPPRAQSNMKGYVRKAR